MAIDRRPLTYELPGAIQLDPCVYTQGMNMTRVKERRLAPREKMSETVLFRMAAPGTPRQFFSAELADISSGGVLFYTESMLSEGDIIDIFFKRRSAYADTCTRAEVLRVNNLGAHYEIGAKFIPACGLRDTDR